MKRGHAALTHVVYAVSWFCCPCHILLMLCSTSVQSLVLLGHSHAFQHRVRKGLFAQST